MSSVVGVRKCPGLCSHQSVSQSDCDCVPISALVCRLNSQTQTPARHPSDSSVIWSPVGEARLVTRQPR